MVYYIYENGFKSICIFPLSLPYIKITLMSTSLWGEKVLLIHLSPNISPSNDALFIATQGYHIEKTS